MMAKRALMVLLLTVPVVFFVSDATPQRLDPQNVGELVIDLRDNTGPLTIQLEAQGSVWGKSQDGYPLTTDYDLISESITSIMYVDHVGSEGSSNDGVIGYGRYRITIQGHQIYVDYRDCDYQDGTSGPGTGYSSADLWVYYSASNGKFYKDSGLANQIAENATVAIWEDGRRSPAQQRTGCFLKVEISGPTSLPYGEQGTFTAETHGVWPISTYEWFKKYEFEEPLSLPSGWFPIGDNSPTVQTGGTVDFWLKVKVTDSSGDWKEAYHWVNILSSRLAGSSFEAAPLGVRVMPPAFKLHPSFPNPFNPETRLRYDLPEPGHVTLTVHNLLGKRILTLVEARQDAGSHSVQWAAKDHLGNDVASGVYVVKLTVRPDQPDKPAFNATRRLILVR